MEDKKIFKQLFQEPNKHFSPTNTKRSSWKSPERTQSQGFLWVNSPCSMNFSSKLPALERSQRFKINSIYNRDDPFKPAKVVNEFHKPDLLLFQFRRSIKQVDKLSQSKEKQLQRQRNDRKGYYKQLNDYLHKRNTLSKVSLKNTLHIDFSEVDQIGLGSDFASKQKQIVQRLCPKKPKLLKMEYDKYGNRSSYFANENQNPKIERKSQKNNLLKLNLNARNFSFGRSQSHFTDSERFDMSRPENFNPGPGSYFQTRKKEEWKKGNHKITQSENLNDQSSIDNSKHMKANKDENMNDSLEERQHQLGDHTTTIHVNYEDNFESDSWQNE